ncbi:N-acetyltransferase [Paenibacillus albiflavus]|uniref:N-acetyltransferase n=1 Tax=Paenibacillus albiflavus TaxID=2545760 RepID=A0A4R4EK98_9BACL|nr:N-acetyltransferase [Paenibacillus albiflavus]TCZ79873.1 N-acetyltransferase [Paenibacillus albiflavus]
MIIRTETIDDYKQVYQLNYLAFGNRDDEAQLVEKIRHTDGFIPELSIVAEQENQILGHILLSKASVVDGDKECEVIVLAPIAVHPDDQKRGIGGKLIQEGVKRCKAAGYPLILLIGHPTYYPKYGFKPARSYGLNLQQFEVPDNVFMVKEVIEGSLGTIKGELKYPAVFF